MQIRNVLSAAICAGALALAGTILSEGAATQNGALPSVEHGKKLFIEERLCSGCHMDVVAPKPSVLGKLDREAFQEKVDNHAKVGAFDGLTKEDLDDIHAYLQTQAEK